MLTSVLLPSACASCRLCCNFLPFSAWESPALEPECVELLRERGVCLVEREDGAVTFHLNFASDAPQEAADCPLLDRCAGCTLPRAQRPFECRLWPLRLMHDEAGSLLLTCYRSCPGLAPVPLSDLLALAEVLRPALLAHARRCPASVRPLHPNYTVLCQLSEPPSSLSVC